MGIVLALLGCVGIVVGLIALLRGMARSAGGGSRRTAILGIVGSALLVVVVVVVGVAAVGRATPDPPVSSGASAGSGGSSPATSRTSDGPPPGTAGDSTSGATSPSSADTGSGTAALSRVPADEQQAGVERAVALLATLPVKGRAPRTGYSRARFGQAWTDDNDEPLGRNGCDTRNDILGRDLAAVAFKPGTRNCTVLRGTLIDPYTGRTIEFTRGATTSTAVQIDHVVALGNAWQTGAQGLSDRLRVDLANDPLELLAVDGGTNQAKGDGDAATWLPPNKAYRCSYVARQIAVKARYGLWVTSAEHDAMARVLDRCGGLLVPAETRPPTAPAGPSSAVRTSLPN